MLKKKSQGSHKARDKKKKTKHKIHKKAVPEGEIAENLNFFGECFVGDSVADNKL